VSILDLNEEVELGEYYCLLAESLDAEELDEYHNYLLAGGETKKWKWSSPDKAGTVVRGSSKADAVTEKMMDITKQVFKVDPDQLKLRGRAEEWAEATERRILFLNPDGFVFDRTGTLVKEYDKTSDFVIKVDYDGNRL
jgi:hypothetical protein